MSKKAKVFVLLLIAIVWAVIIWRAISVSEGIRIINASLAGCHSSIDKNERILLLPEWVGFWFRAIEKRRHDAWVIEDRSIFSVIAAAYEYQPAACRIKIMELIDIYIANGADINNVRSRFRNMSILQEAIMDGSSELTCELLQRGASLEIRVDAIRADGTVAPIHNLSLYELAKHQARQQPDATNLHLLEVIENFRNNGRCAEREAGGNKR